MAPSTPRVILVDQAALYLSNTPSGSYIPAVLLNENEYHAGTEAAHIEFTDRHLLPFSVPNFMIHEDFRA